MVKKIDKWFTNYARNLHSLGTRYACLTSEGESYSQNEILKKLRGGVKVWNRFSNKMPPIRWYRGRKWMPGFLFLIKDIDLRGIDLTGYDLSGTRWENVNFHGCKLIGALMGSIPFRPQPVFKECNFRRARFRGNFFGTNFIKCNFERAELNGARFSYSDFIENNLRGAIVAATFENCNLTDTNFSQSFIDAAFLNINLGTAKGLNNSPRIWEVSVDYKTLINSQPIPKTFFKRAGIAEPLLNAVAKMQKKQHKYKLGKVFISYSDIDRSFAEKLYGDLIDLGIDCFFAPHDMPIGAKSRDTLETKLTEANNVILVLSKSSINSSWVEYEIETIYEREKIVNSTILLPIRIDNQVMKTKKALAANLRRTRNIGDFIEWNQSDYYKHSFKKLIDSANKVDSGK